MTEQVVTAPAAASIWSRTSPIAVVFFFITVLRTAINAGWYRIVGIWGAIQAGKASFILPALAVLAMLGIALAILSWWRFRYRLSNNKILIRKGVLQRDQVTIEFSKVQNVRLLEPVYARPFGLALLEIDTAGSARQEVTLGGIDLGLARRLRDRIVGHQDHIDPTMDPEPDVNQSDQATQLLLNRSVKEICIYGLTHNGLFWVAAVIGGIFSQVDEEAWMGPQRLFAWFNVDAWPVWQILGFALLAVCLLPLLSALGAIWRHYDYRLYRRHDVYRRQSGLLSKHDETIKRHKIQAAIWHQNFIAKWFGRVNLKLRQAKAGSADADVPGSRKPSFLVPVLRPQEAASLTSDMLPGLDIEMPSFSRVQRVQYIKKNLLYSWSWVIAMIHLALAFAIGLWTLWLAPLSLLFIAGCLYISWRKLGYAISGDHGLTRTGFVGSKVTIFPLFKVQRIDLRQSPSQRRLGLAHLTFHLASHSITIPYIHLVDAQRIRDLTLYTIESSQQRWF